MLLEPAEDWNAFARSRTDDDKFGFGEIRDEVRDNGSIRVVDGEGRKKGEIGRRGWREILENN